MHQKVNKNVQIVRNHSKVHQKIQEQLPFKKNKEYPRA
jgi:hypothetical protein